MSLSSRTIFDLMAAAPAASAWSDAQIAQLESDLSIVVPEAYARFLRFAVPDRLFDPIEWEIGLTYADLIDFQRKKNEMGFAYRFQPQDYLLGHHQGYELLLIQTDVRDSNPPVLYVRESQEAPSQTGLTIEQLVISRVGDMMGVR
jgi:hypothetical protein